MDLSNSASPDSAPRQLDARTEDFVWERIEVYLSLLEGWGDWEDEEDEPWMHTELWELIRLLHWRGSHRSAERAVAWTKSTSPERIYTGLDVLAQLRWEQQELYRDVAQEASNRCLESEDVDVLQSALAMRVHRQFGHTDRVFELARHPHDFLRQTVAWITPHKDDAAEVELLIELSRDPDSDVRDWATFGLGQIYSEHSGSDLLQAIEARFTDSDIAVRMEAFLGYGERLDAKWTDDLMSAELDQEGCVREWKVLAGLAKRFPHQRWIAPLEFHLAQEDCEEGWGELRAALDLNTKA